MTLRAEYQYSFASKNTLGILGHLIKMAAAKHQLGMKKPNAKMIEKVSDKILPHRDEGSK